LIEVFDLLGAFTHAGRTRKGKRPEVDLAIILNTSRHTIPHHVEAILGRLNLATRAEIMLCALEALGWLRWPTKRRGKTPYRQTKTIKGSFMKRKNELVFLVKSFA
jgi:hypothetical protein